MELFVPKETLEGETRAPLTPETAQDLKELELTINIEQGLGESINFADSDYEAFGVNIVQKDFLAEADIVLRLNKPELEEVSELKEGAVYISLLDPFQNLDLVKALAKAKVSSFCMELIPRSSYAQKMDVLSSQASLAGYVAVILAAERINKVLPMMSTPAGTIPPAKVLIIGAGVAGLQAIATAKRLGARVDAYDTRPVVEEQVKSLGAKFLKIDVGSTGQTKQGYAKALTEEQLEEQRQQMSKFCASADIIITTAQLFGRPAPQIITEEMVENMNPGSVIVDLAASTGGNVAGSEPDEEVIVNGVKIIGLTNLPASVAKDASEMYASNAVNLIKHIWDSQTKTIKLDLEDEIVNGALLTHEGQIRNDNILEASKK